MAQCMYCNKKSIFLTIDKNKSCKSCSPFIQQAVTNHLRIIKESKELVEKSKNYKTRIGRIDDILDHLNYLKDYANKGYQLTGDIDANIIKYLSLKEKMINKFANITVTECLQKADLAKTLNSKLNNANKAILFLEEMKKQYDFKDSTMLGKIKEYTHLVEYKDLYEKAEKEEFKGNSKKAIDKYMDVLFFLKKDDIDDNLQSKDINMIEEKIKGLQQQV
ncbi:hypothetical protein [Psychrobacillus sp. FSL K6-1415]|uniref:hypothetical protein n=1 Tax=Psychrobacillus sp. FSL K6-1415 TaxID=2921544 RepID=UPI0030F897FE